MRSKPARIWTCLVLALFAISALTGCKQTGAHVSAAFDVLLQAVERGDPDDLSMEIYYIHPWILTRAPLTVDELIHSSLAERISVNGEQLKEHAEWLCQLHADGLIPVEHTSCLNARLYCVVTSEKDGKILEIAVGGENNSVFVNGLEVEQDDRFRDLIALFVPDEVMRELEYTFHGEPYMP